MPPQNHLSYELKVMFVHLTKKPKNNLLPIICVTDCFSKIHTCKRVHKSFKRKLQEDNNLKNSTRLSIPNFGIIRTLDYIHLCCSEVIKILFSKPSLPPKKLKILSWKNCVTFHFSRKPIVVIKKRFSNWKTNCISTVCFIHRMLRT